MLPPAQIAQYVQTPIPFYSLDGVTVLIGGFLFYGLARPGVVKRRTPFWAAFACLLGIVLLYTLRLMLYNSPAGQVVTGILIGLAQVAGLVLTAMYAGGLDAAEVADELRAAAADWRRDESPAAPRPPEPPRPAAPAAAPAVPPRVVIDLPKPPADDRIPLE